MWTRLVPVLFAETTDLERGGTYALLLVLGGGVQWGITTLLGRLDKNRSNAKEDETTAIARYRELYDQQQRDKEDCKEDLGRLEAKVVQLTDKVLSLTVSIVRAVEWIRYHETLLKANGIKYEPFVSDGTSPPAAPALQAPVNPPPGPGG